MTRRLIQLALIVLLAACGSVAEVSDPAPAPAAVPAPTLAPTATPAPASPTPTPTPAPADNRPNRPLVGSGDSLLDPANACAAGGPEALAAAPAFAQSLPFSAEDCLAAVTLPDRREVLLGAGGAYVPVHTARLGPGSKILAPLAGQIEFRTMQSDLPPGYHLYGAGSLRITIRPQGEGGRSVEHNPVIYLYVPGDSVLAAEFSERPGLSAGALVARRQVIVESLGTDVLDAEGAEHDLIIFYEADQQFVDTLAPGSEQFWVGGKPTV